MGFSPQWDPEILYIKAVLLGADFHETAQGQLAWNEEHLRDAVKYIRTWMLDVNGGPGREQEFTDKYLYDPSYKLIDSGRIAFYYTTLRDFFGIPAEKRKEIDYRWIAKEGRSRFSRISFTWAFRSRLDTRKLPAPSSRGFSPKARRR
jgi:hypothetical protein